MYSPPTGDYKRRERDEDNLGSALSYNNGSSSGSNSGSASPSVSGFGASSTGLGYTGRAAPMTKHEEAFGAGGLHVVSPEADTSDPPPQYSSYNQSGGILSR